MAMPDEKNNTEEEVMGMMAMSDSYVENDSSEVSTSNLKENSHSMSKKNN